MCGRVSLGDLTTDNLREYFVLDQVAPIPNSFNVAPSQLLPVVRQLGCSRVLHLLLWGLVPHWAKDREIARHTFNARIETLTRKPSFRAPFKAQRCIVTASGFYEWQKQEEQKQPFYVHRPSRQPLALAGLWDAWLDKESGNLIESCTIVTTKATGAMADIHQRMPAILEPELFAAWLDPRFGDTHRLQDLLESNTPELEMFPVSGYVSNAYNDGKRCLRPLETVSLR